MIEIRIHGRGGQGAVLAAELLAVAAFEDGKFGQAFPAFGGERRGAAVQAFVRVDTCPIRRRYRVNNPDYVVILDQSLLNVVDVLYGLKPDGLVLVNSEQPPALLEWSTDARVYAVPATRIAIEIFGRPLVNPAMLGALAAASGAVSLAAIQRSFEHRFPGDLGEKNSQAAQLGYNGVCSVEATPVQARASQRVSGGLAAWEQSAGLGAPGRPLHFAAVVAPRTSLAYATGAWRYSRPIVDESLCNGCGVCEMLCPDGCIFVLDKKAVADYVYCKGCGICAQECARGAIRMMAEEA